MSQYAVVYHTDLRLPDLTIKEVCQGIGVTPPTVYKMLSDGQLKSYKVGRCRRITRESFEALRLSLIHI